MTNRFGIKKEDLEEEVESKVTTSKSSKEQPNNGNDFIGSKLVLYTDGGCRPSSRGFGGYGMHGYFYSDDIPKQGSGCKLTPTARGYVDIKVNAVTVLKYCDFWATIQGEATNNIAEIKAIIESIEMALETKATSLLILTDSQNTIDSITKWIEGWKKRGWTKSSGEPVSNVEYWKTIDKLLVEMEVAGCAFELVKVKGHSDDLGNDLADDHATRGVILTMDGVTKRHMQLSSSKGYWNPKLAPNRFLGKSSWYFSSNVCSSTYLSCDGRFVYMLGKHGAEDKFLGKRVSDSSYAVVYLKEADNVLESIRERQSKLTVGSNIVIGKLDTIRQPVRYEDISVHGGTYLTKSSKSPNCDLVTPSEVLLTKEMIPARLAYRAIDILTTLDGLLESFVKKYDKLTLTEITSTFYLEETNKKGVTKTVFNPEVKQAAKHVELEVNLPFKDDTVEDIKLLFDMDIPSRNVLSALCDQNPKIYVITYLESDKSYRFATVVETEDNVGIWSSVHSNLKLKQTVRIGK